MKLLKVRLTKKADKAPRKLMKVRCGDLVEKNEAIASFANFALAGKKPIKYKGGPRTHVHFEWRFPGIIFGLSAFPGEDENFTPSNAYITYQKQGQVGYDKDKYPEHDSFTFHTVEEGKRILLDWAKKFGQRLTKPEEVNVSLTDFDKYFEKLKIHGVSSRFIQKGSLEGRRWEYPGLKLYAIYDIKKAAMLAKWEKRKLKGYKEDTFGEEGTRSFSTLHEGGTILLQFAKQFEQRLERPVKVLKRSQKSSEELRELKEIFDKIFGRGSKYFNEYGGHYATYAQNAESAWDYLGGDIVLVLGDKGGMVLETAFGDVVRFKAGDFDGVKRRLEKFLKEYGDDE